MTLFSEAIRRYGFWFTDALTGGYVRKYLLRMKSTLEGAVDSDSDDLQMILCHAVNTTEFYREYKGFSSIRDFPVVKKNMIKEKYDQFISSEYRNRKLHQVQTSGSTGERFVMLQDGQKRKRVVAELIYFLEQSGFRLGYKHIHARVWTKENRKTKLEQMTHNTVMFNCSSLSEESLQNLCQLLHQDHSIKCLTGYATFLTAIAYHFDSKGYTPDMFNMKIIVSGAERLEESAKAMLKKVFGCTVVSRYANNENGFLAQQPNDGDEFLLNTAHYFFETLHLDDDEPADYGEPARLVITDLYSYAMPLIRYDTGDIVIAEVSDKHIPAKIILTDVCGRQDEIIYDTRGNRISPHFVAFNFRRYDRLPQFQFIQESLKNFTVKLEGVRGLYEDRDVIKTVKELVGQDAVINIEHVDKIQHHSSGKLKKIICNYNADSGDTRI
jgi:phenylacetate-CoA ligase